LSGIDSTKHSLNGISKHKTNTALCCSFAICVILLCSTLPVQGQVYVGGELTANETYSPVNNPYIVTQDLIVTNDVTLTILPGVELLFEYGTSLINNGTLIAKGTPGEHILFLPKNQQSFAGQWYGIVFNKSKTFLDADSAYFSGSVLSDAEISYATYAITLDNNSSLLVEETQINQSSFGIHIKQSDNNTIRNCVFTACDFGIFLANGFNNPGNNIYGNRIYSSSDVGIFINSNSLQTNRNFITGNYIHSCNIGIHAGNYGNNGAGNNVISGNTFLGNKDALKLFQGANTVSNNYFVLNRNGVICWKSNSNIITQNLFSRNVLFAVTLAAGSSFNNITHNGMNYNSGAVWAKPDSSGNSLFNSFLYNTIYKNTDFSFQIKNTPQGSLQFNNIFNNGDFQSFQNQSDSLIHTEYCYWGSINESAIDSIIYDVKDNPATGEVFYQPVLTDILSTAPVPPPDNVIKQRIGNDVVVSWDALILNDLTGYNVYYKPIDGISYSNVIHNGMNTSVNLGNFPIEDSVVVTAYDFLATGTNDQPSGHESDFAFAIIAPYAGPDTAICYSSSYSITDATALDYESLTWSTSGDGTFSNTHILKTVYYPGEQDYLNGYVNIFLKAVSGEYQYQDAARITFHDAPEVHAGNDTILSMDSTLWLVEATASGYDHLKWTTSGDGTFDADTLKKPVYTPGQQDKDSGEVTLFFTAYSACGQAIDQISLLIDPGYSIEGRIHAGTVMATNSTLSILQSKNGSIKPIRAGLVTSDGNFKIKSLFIGDYYLYAIPDKTVFPTYLPTYYFNDIKWGNAYKLKLNANTYDVDIDLAKLTVQLPEGGGSIFGYCTATAGNNESCGDVTILLYDKLMKNVLDWVLVSNGSDFRFKNLPYGDYVLVGEKTGLPSFYSDVLVLTASQPKVENIELLCSSAGYKFYGSGNSDEPDGSANIALYPNPASDRFYIKGLVAGNSYDVRIFNSQGRVEKFFNQRELNENFPILLDELSSGLYFVEVWTDGICIMRQKLLKN
jgi:parallel beta-helix repeat protein